MAAHAADVPTSATWAAHSTALGSELPEWVQLLPAGTFNGRDGRGPYSVPLPQRVIDRTREWAAGHDLPIDVGHALEAEGLAGAGAPAAGWITDLESREGALWGRVEWTDEGARRVRGREFRFLSPVFMHDKAGEVLFVMRAGLTNIPNLRMVAVHSQSTQEKDVALLATLITIFGLPAESTEDAVAAHCRTVAQSSASLQLVAQSVKLPTTASADEIVKAVQAVGTPDPAKWIPREQYDTLATSVNSQKEALRTAAVDAAIQDGKITPAQREWAFAYHAKDEAGFASFVAAAPKVVGRGAEAHTSGSGKRALTDAEKSVCAQLNITEEDFLKNVEG